MEIPKELYGKGKNLVSDSIDSTKILQCSICGSSGSRVSWVSEKQTPSTFRPLESILQEQIPYRTNNQQTQIMYDHFLEPLYV